MATNTVENYIKCIFHLSAHQSGKVPTTRIAEHLGVKSSTVTDMIQKLKGRKLVAYTKYQGATLTKEGERMALDIVRKHRLWEVFLVEQLGFRWDEVHDIAEQLEHVQSAELINRLDDFLGKPVLDPHGDPIPARDGSFKPLDQQLMNTLVTGETAAISGVTDDEPSLLHFLESQNLQLRTRFTVDQVVAFDESMIVAVADRTVSLSQKMTSHIYVVKQP